MRNEDQILPALIKLRGEIIKLAKVILIDSYSKSELSSTLESRFELIDEVRFKTDSTEIVQFLTEKEGGFLNTTNDFSNYAKKLFLNALLGKLEKACEKKIEENDTWAKRFIIPQLKIATYVAKEAREAMGVILPKEPSIREKFSQCFGSLFKKKEMSSVATCEKTANSTTIFDKVTTTTEEITSPLLLYAQAGCNSLQYGGTSSTNRK